MFKTLVMLSRGAAAAAEEKVADRSALLILNQQIRDAACAIKRGRRALAIAIVQDERERKRLEAAMACIHELKERAVAALAAGREDLATNASETIAEMENDCAVIATARASFANEIAHLRSTVSASTRRLAALDRGRRIARAADAVQQLRMGPHAQGIAEAAALAGAEDTLQRLRERQAHNAAVDSVRQSLDADIASTTLIRRLEAAGYGLRTQTTAADVLDRLRNLTECITAVTN